MDDDAVRTAQTSIDNVVGNLASRITIALVAGRCKKTGKEHRPAPFATIRREVEAAMSNAGELDAMSIDLRISRIARRKASVKMMFRPSCGPLSHRDIVETRACERKPVRDQHIFPARIDARDIAGQKAGPKCSKWTGREHIATAGNAWGHHHWMRTSTASLK